MITSEDRTLTIQEALEPELVTVIVFGPILPNIALKPLPLGLFIMSSGEDQVYWPFPPAAVKLVVCPSVTVGVVVKHERVPLWDAMTETLQLTACPALETVTEY